MFCVYIHYRETDGLPFYVGKGTKDRPYFFYGRSKWWYRVHQKHGCRVVIVVGNMSEADAFALEMRLISEIGRDNLCNHTDGGEGCSNPSPETRAKMSAAKKGKPKSPEAIRKHAEKMRGRKMSPERIENLRQCNLGSKHTPETRVKMSRSARKKPSITEETRVRMSIAQTGRKNVASMSVYFITPRNSAWLPNSMKSFGAGVAVAASRKGMVAQASISAVR